MTAIRQGDTAALRRLLEEHPGLAQSRIDDPQSGRGVSRTLLHVATDWPGHFPHGVDTIALLITAGADVNARFIGHHTETPLHWAASSDDVAVLDALLDAGADIEADGGVIAHGTPLADAVAFGQWSAARRLLERGAQTNLWQAAALGLLARLEEQLSGPQIPTAEEITSAFWCACHGGQRATAEVLLGHRATLNWIGYDGLTPLDAARRSNAVELAVWLESLGAVTASG